MPAQAPRRARKVEEEVAKSGPNAHSQKPDSPPNNASDQTKATATKDGSKEPAAAQTAAILVSSLLALSPASDVFPSDPSGAVPSAAPTAIPAATDPNPTPSPQDLLPQIELPPMAEPNKGPSTPANAAVVSAGEGRQSGAHPTQAIQSAGNAKLIEDLTQQAAALADSSEPTVKPVVTAQTAAQTAAPPVNTPANAPQPASSMLAAPTVAQVTAKAAAENTQDQSSQQSDGDAPTDSIEEAVKAVASSKTPSSGKDTPILSKTADIQAPLPPVKTDTAPVSSNPPTEATGLKAGEINLVVKQIADKMQLLAATQSKDGITIQLQPDSLGTISMTVKSMAGTVQAHIAASNDNVRTALEQNRSLLGQAMSERGLKLEAVSIAAQTQTSTSAQRQSAQQQQAQGQGQRSQTSTSAPGDGASTRSGAIQAARAATRGVDGVDLWI